MTFMKQNVSTRSVPIPGVPGPLEAEIPISQLPLAGPLLGGEMVALVQNGGNVRSTATAIGSVGAAPIYMNKVLSLYYVAIPRQTAFPTQTADRFGNTANLGAGGLYGIQVSVNGVRLALDDGSGYGGYTVDYLHSTVNLLAPANSGDVVIIDLYDLASPIVATVPGILRMDSLIIATLNVLPPLSYAVDGILLILFVNGQAFFAQGANPAFTFAGNRLTWISSAWSVLPGAEVCAVYSTGGPGTPPAGTGIPDAPNDGQLYGREFQAWHLAAAPASPVFTGVPTGPTAAPGTNTQQLATCAFVTGAVVASTAGVASFNARTGAVVLTAADVVNAGPGYLALAGGTMTGPLILNADPAAALGAATRQYVDTIAIDAGTF